MGWYNNYAQGCFKTLLDGREGFYPYFISRRGYLVSNEERTVLRRFMFGAGILSPLLGVMTGDAIKLWNFPMNLIVLILSLSLFSVGYYGGMWWLTKNLERAPSDERPTLSEYYSTRAQHTGWMTLWLLEICTLLFVVTGLYVAASGKDRSSLLVGLSAIMFFGLCAWAGGYMLWAKSTRRA